MAGKPRTAKPRAAKPKAEKPRAEKPMAEKPMAETSGEPSYIPASWQQPSEVGMNFGTYLQIEKHAVPKTPSGSAGQAAAGAESAGGNGLRARPSFRRGRIWA